MSSDSGADEQRRKDEKPAATLEESAQLAAEQWIFGGAGAPLPTLKNLDSYDDLNWHVRTAGARSQEYLLKLHNGVETDNVPLLLAQDQMMEAVGSADGLTCPMPIPPPGRTPAPGGRAASWVQCDLPVHSGGRRTLAVRMLTWVPGSTLNAHGATATSLEAVGQCVPVAPRAPCRRPAKPPPPPSSRRYLGKVDAALAPIEAPGLVRTHLWDLRSAPLLAPFVVHVERADRRALVLRVLESFAQVVSPVAHTLRMQAIMGDCNDANIIVDKTGCVAARRGARHGVLWAARRAAWCTLASRSHLFLSPAPPPASSTSATRPGRGWSTR